jgi:hypothetical protein
MAPAKSSIEYQLDSESDSDDSNNDFIEPFWIPKCFYRSEEIYDLFQKLIFHERVFKRIIPKQ